MGFSPTASKLLQVALRTGCGRTPPSRLKSTLSLPPTATQCRNCSSHRIYPPGAGASNEKATSFANMVAESLSKGSTVDLTPHGNAAVWHCIRVFCIGQAPTEFTVSFAREGDGEARSRGLNIKVRYDGSWDDFETDTSTGSFVSKDTNLQQAAKKLEFDLRKSKEKILHAYGDSEEAVAKMVKAAAMAPDYANRGFVSSCSVGSVAIPGKDVPKVILRVRKIVPQFDADEFVAFPPGRGADAATLKLFNATILSRLSQGQTIVMEIRGPDAASNVVSVLGLLRSRVAKFQLRWVDAYVADQDQCQNDRVPRALKLRVQSGETWQAFNSTDFKKTGLLRPSTKIENLASSIANEVGNKGAVSMRTWKDSTDGIFNTLKAIATVPVTQSRVKNVDVVTSFGSSGDRKTVSFYIRRAKPAFTASSSDA